ncbi:MFS transporter [Streptomyces viridochromogenes]|uniref:MFS transporter n=1 Tax=Streptomyces viridochromogenes TaxID=1938 RepID=A0A0J7ZND5_STRVR|nr:MFS transporter [Streptomyces viridochromogenes]KOG23397.1 MFS transporter [Streptomyces viridochromogenes]KOG27357.1 MFS transporter [Streptomyces viridochromogenes]
MVWGATLTNQLGSMVIPYLSYFLIQDRNISLSVVGVVLAMSGLGGVISQLCGGLLVDRIGYRATMTLGMSGTGIFLFVLGAVDQVALIALFAFLVGLAAEMHRPASASMIAAHYAPADRPKAYGLLYWAVNLGYAFSMVFGGSLVRHGFTVLFWVNSAACVGAGLLVWIMGKPTVIPRQAADSDARSGSYLDVARDRLMLAYLGSWFAYGIVFCQALTTLPLAMKLDGIEPSTFGYVMATNAVVIIMVQPVAGPLLSRLDHSHVLIGGIIVLGIGYGATALVSTPVGYATTVAIWTLGEVAVSSVNQAVIASLAPAPLRGRYYGLYGMTWSTASLAAPLMGTWLLQWQATGLWAVCVLLCCGAAAGQWLLRPHIKARSASMHMSGASS